MSVASVRVRVRRTAAAMSITKAQRRVLEVLAEADYPVMVSNTTGIEHNPETGEVVNAYVHASAAAALCEAGLVEEVYRDGPSRSSWTRYRITDAGREALG